MESFEYMTRSTIGGGHGVDLFLVCYPEITLPHFSQKSEMKTSFHNTSSK